MEPADQVRQWTTLELGRRWPTRRWWRAHLADAIRDGAINRRGRVLWARASDIEAWLLGRPARGRRHLELVPAGDGR